MNIKMYKYYALFQRELILKEEEIEKKLQEKDEEGRLALEELELRFKSVTVKEDSQLKLSQELELTITKLSSEKQQLQSQLSALKTELSSVCEQIKDELKDELDSLRDKLKETQQNLEESQLERSKANEIHADEKVQLEHKIETLKKVADDKKDLFGDNERLKSELEAKEEELNKVESTLKNIEIELETQLTSVSQLSENNQILQNVQQKHDTLESELQVKLEELKGYSCQLEEANRANQDCQNQLKSTCDQLEAFKQEISEKNNDVIQLESALQMAKQKSESHENQLEQVMSQLAQGDENHNSSLAAFKKKSTDLEKEIIELKNREASLKSNEQQMIAYQKELQDQIVAFEETETCFDVQLLQAKQRLTDKEEEMKQLAIDLELKSRLEREKLENALQMAEQKSENHANQLEQVMSQLAQGDENHNSSLAAFKKKSTDLEKEILELKNREASLKSNEQQMIAYQKELQDQIGAFEETESRFQRQLEQAKQRLTDKEDEIKQLAIDLELKSRYEQEKEVSNKELQMQSIEYQKKLQDQLEQAKTENDTLLRESDSLAKQLNDKVQEALKETETLRSQLNATKVRIKKVNVWRFLKHFGGIIRAENQAHIFFPSNCNGLVLDSVI